MTQVLRDLRDHILDHEDRLVDQVIDEARRNGYLLYTPNLTRAWRESIAGLSEDLAIALTEGDERSAIAADIDHRTDPSCRFALETARRHRARGVTLGLFLGLFKHFRACYLNLTRECSSRPAHQALCQRRINGLFDRMEIAICTDWTSPDKEAALDELTAKNRLLTKEKDKYLTLFESIQDPVLVLDRAGQLENLNAAAWRLLGIEPDSGEAYYRRPGELPALEHLTALLADQPLADGTSITLATGQGRRSFDVHRREILDIGGKYSGSVVVLNDVTIHLRALAETEQANRVKSAFLATVSHEIRTPLNGILGAVRLLRRDPLNPAQQTYAEAISRSGERLRSLIDNVLDYSRIEAGRLPLDTEPFSLAEVVSNLTCIMTPHAEELGLGLALDTPELPSYAVRGDACKLQQVLLNLIGNALKFSEQGQVVTLRLRLGPGDLVRFEVEDHGRGIDPSERERLFEPFTQLRRERLDRDRGSGLGLAICRQLAEIMGASIGVRSVQPRGSLFWIELSLPQASEPIAPVCRSGATTVTTRPLSILLIEDDEVNQLVARGLLECAGHRVTLAASGKAAMRALEQDRGQGFDLVLLDIRLPDLDGFDLSHRIRELTEWRLPIVAVTAHAARHELDRHDSIDAFLIKPLDPEALERVLARLSREDRRAPFLDKAVLSDHLERLGLARTERILEAFEQVCDKTLTELGKRSLNATATITEVSHRLRGSANGLGLRNLAQQAAKLEVSAERVPSDELEDLIEELTQSVERSRRVLASAWQTLLAQTAAVPNAPEPTPQRDSQHHAR